MLAGILSGLLRRHRFRTSEQKIAELRRRGVRIGNCCEIYTMEFSTEPYLIDIGDRVFIAGGVQFITHNGVAALLRHKHPDIQVFGRIRVGSGCFLGFNSIVLPGVEIGEGCIVGAGSVVRGLIPPGSLAIGNPAAIVGDAADTLAKLEASPHRLDLLHASAEQRRNTILNHFGLPFES